MCLSAVSRRLPTAASASIALSLFIDAVPLRCRAFYSFGPCNRMGDWSVYAHTFHCTHARLRGRLEPGDCRRLSSRSSISAPKLASALKPGQFVNIAVPGDASSLLRVPLSFYRADAEAGTVELWYAVVGDDTRRLSQMGPGSTSNLLGPGGRGWMVPEGTRKALLVAGASAFRLCCVLPVCPCRAGC